MADNVNISAGSGKTIATDDVGGAQYQLIKPAFGTDGNATLVSATNPLPVTVGSVTGTIGVYVDSTQGTLAVQFRNEPTVISSGKEGTTTRPVRMNSDGAIKVYDLAAGT